jgi:hypothetical protein
MSATKIMATGIMVTGTASGSIEMSVATMIADVVR